MQESTSTHKGRTNTSADDIETAFERLRQAIKKLAEDRDAGFKRLSKQIADLDARWAEKWKEPS